MSAPTSFLQTSTGGNPLECDCERVKCNCVKRCECGLPTGTENRQASQFLELASATGKSTAPLWVDIDTNECFLQTGESVGQDTHHMLDCECDKVKCNCVKHCECSLPVSTGSAASRATNNLLQLDQGLELKKPEEKSEEKSEEKTEAKLEEKQQEKPQKENEELIQQETAEVKKTSQDSTKGPKRRGRKEQNNKKSVEKKNSASENVSYSESASYGGKSGYSYYSEEEH